MQFEEFRRVVTCFADSVDDVDASKGDLLVQIRDETITAKLHERPDDDVRVVQRFLRAFLRSNALNESTIRQRLGVNSSRFFKSLLPELLQAGVVREVPYLGHGTQRRMKLAVPMTRIEEAMRAAGGKFDDLVQAFRQATDAARR